MAQQRQYPQDQDNGMGLLWGFGGTCLAFIIIWLAFHSEISGFFLLVHDYKLKVIEWIFGEDATRGLAYIRYQLTVVSPDLLTFGDLMSLNIALNRYYMPIVGLIIMYWSYRMFTAKVFRTKFNAKRLLAMQAQMYPELNVPFRHDILKESTRKGSWACSRQAVELLRDFKLTDDEGDVVDEKAEAHLISQIGKPYKGPGSLSKYQKAMFGICAAIICGKNQEAMNATDNINRSYNGKTLNLSFGHKLFDKYFTGDRVQSFVKSHHFISTILYRLFVEAKAEMGVLPSTRYLWLKPLSRSDWYIVNNVGRRVSWPDIAGVFAHYQAELKHGKPITKPFVMTGVEGLKLIARKRII